MTGKTGAARIALETGCPVIPIGQWGAQAAAGAVRQEARPVPAQADHDRRSATPSTWTTCVAGRAPPRCCSQATDRIMAAHHRRSSRSSAARRRRPSGSTRARPASPRSATPTRSRRHDQRRRPMSGRSRCSAPARGGRRSPSCSPTPATTSRCGRAARRSRPPSTSERENPDYLPGIELPPPVTRDPRRREGRWHGADVVVLAVPSQTLRGNLDEWAPVHRAATP